jgi:hypothetical protein
MCLCSASVESVGRQADAHKRRRLHHRSARRTYAPKLYCASPAKQWTQCRPAWRRQPIHPRSTARGPHHHFPSRRAQNPIASAAPWVPTSRGFIPWRFSNAEPGVCLTLCDGPAFRIPSQGRTKTVEILCRLVVRMRLGLALLRISGCLKSTHRTHGYASSARCRQGDVMDPLPALAGTAAEPDRAIAPDPSSAPRRAATCLKCSRVERS